MILRRIENDFTGESPFSILLPWCCFFNRFCIRSKPMIEDNVLQLELDKLDVSGLKRVAQVWNLINIGKDKKTIIKNIINGMQDEFFLKGVLEKLSATQVTILTSILKSKSSILTLGEISRKISLPPVNTEMELGVLKRYFLVYQRKNRERLTNSLDKYYFFPESGDIVKIDTNEKGQKFRLSLTKILQSKPTLHDFWLKTFGIKKSNKNKVSSNDISSATDNENIEKLIASLTDNERFLISECFLQGGIIDINDARDIIASRKGKWEETLKKLHHLAILNDSYYIDEKFIRVLVLPPEIFIYLQEHPIHPLKKRGTRRRQEKKTVNDLDFYLNIKKMIVYISRKGLNLAKSGKIKQVDLRETENRLLRPDIGLFIEKSEIYQIELLLPVMRLLDIVRVKRDDVVLRNKYEEILDIDPFKLMDRVVKVITDARNRRLRYEDVFEPLYIQFYRKEIFDQCVNYIVKCGPVLHFVVMASLIREKLVMSKTFRIKNFKKELNELRREITSTLFYLQLLGHLVVDYPNRRIELSELGLHYLKGQSLVSKNEPGGVIINPDLSLIGIPENISLRGLYILKSFTELKGYDNIYSFQITRESFQEGILIKNSVNEFKQLLEKTSKNELSQNLLFSIEDWSRSLPLVSITDECVVVKTEDSNNMELLLGQINGKKIVVEEISPTTILIDSEKIYETITYAEKLNLIVRLIR